VAYGRLGRWLEAVAAFQQVLDGNPGDLEVTYDLGLAFCHLGRWPEAVKAFQKVLVLRPDHAPACRHLGIACNQMGNWKEAVRCFQQEVLIKPENAGAYLNLGGMFAQVVNWQEAVQAFGKAVQTQPGNAMAYQALGVTYGQLGQWREAAEAFQQAILLGGDEDAAKYASLAPSFSGRWEEVAENLKNALRFNPELGEAQYLLGLVYGRMDRWQEAAVAFANVVRSRSGKLGQVRDRNGESGVFNYYKEALDILRQAINLKPELPQLATALLLEAGSLTASQDRAVFWQRSLEADPGNEEARYQLGMTYLRLGCYPEAINAIKALIRNHPGHALGHYQLAVTYLSSGDFGAAVEEYSILKHLDAKLAEKLFG